MSGLTFSACDVGSVGLDVLRKLGQESNAWPTPSVPNDFTCGYAVDTSVQQSGRKHFKGLIRLTNVEGEDATAFELAVELNGTIKNISGGKIDDAADGYRITAPKSLQRRGIEVGDSHTMSVMGDGNPGQLSVRVVSINGSACDSVPPDVSVDASEGLFTAPGTLTLSADANDGAGIERVVFAQDGVEIGEVTAAPFTFDVEVTAALNGRHRFTATAYDASGNETESEAARVLVAIDNRFLGTAADTAADYATMPSVFNQLTPGNAGKWGVVEATRDVMNWEELDTAYAYARANGMKFKLHTLIWGQQQPNWIAALTPAEQLEELEEWMAAAAERYPDVDLIDVVNEPLHAPPAYAAALGGAGSTGWDWVIRSFELARVHFPDAELLLNDYQILMLAQFTQDYLRVIEVLQERGLIDGIGLQAHFLEQAELPVVEQNLATLAATGLPIYVSELDVNFANDARHANRLRDLVTIFFNQPSVVGVTHWGHLEGNMWRADAHLVYADGSHRPGMDWLVCAYAGGTDCSVPTYVPEGWHGTESGLRIEAEAYDQGQGVLALGNVVSYTDQGDWISFTGVDFQDSWDTFAVTYANGGGQTGSISLHLGSVDGPALVTVPLPPTASWGTSTTIEVPWTPTDGVHDLFVRFNDAYGVGNIDHLQFSASEGDDEGVNLVQNGGFEFDTSGWTPWYLNPTLSVTSELAHSGSQSLRVSNRSSGAGDNARYLLTDVVVPGTTYQVGAWATIGGTSVGTARLSAVIQCSNPPAGHNAFQWIENNSSVTPGEWVYLSGALTIPDCDLTEVSIYFEGTAAGVDMFIDDVSVRPPGGNLIQNASFETGTAGWTTWYQSPTLTTTSALSHDGDRSLVITNRTTGTGETARYVLTPVVTPGTSYAASAWVTVGGTQTSTVRLAAVVQCVNPPAGHNTYPWIQNNSSIVPGEWTQLSGTLAIPDCDLTEAFIYIDGAPAGTDIYVDEVYFGAP